MSRDSYDDYINGDDEPDEAEREEYREYQRERDLSFDNALGAAGPWAIIAAEEVI